MLRCCPADEEEDPLRIPLTLPCCRPIMMTRVRRWSLRLLWLLLLLPLLSFALARVHAHRLPHYHHDRGRQQEGLQCNFSSPTTTTTRDVDRHDIRMITVGMDRASIRALIHPSCGCVRVPWQANVQHMGTIVEAWWRCGELSILQCAAPSRWIVPAGPEEFYFRVKGYRPWGSVLPAKSWFNLVADVYSEASPRMSGKRRRWYCMAAAPAAGAAAAASITTSRTISMKRMRPRKPWIN